MSRWENLIQMMRYSEDAYEGVPTDKSHYIMLYALTKMCNPKAAVEIGSRKGGSAMWIARALEEAGKGTLFCIDPFELVPPFFRMFNRNIGALGLSHRVKLIQKFSDAATSDVPKEFEFLFIDGDHSVEGCTKDIINYVPRVKSGGAVAIHDSRANAGVKDAIRAQKNSTLAPFFDFELWTHDGMWIGIKQ